jgi:hypothetical protein
MKKLLLLTCLLTPVIASAQTTKYFGYFAGDGITPGAPSAFSEMKDHINLYTILGSQPGNTPEDRAVSESYILDQLALAKAAHVHAMVPAAPFIFQVNKACSTPDPTGAANWADFAQKMVDQGYLIPGDAARSTLVAVYISDEPNSKSSCLNDSGGAANPTFQGGVSILKQNPLTSALPIASVLSRDASNFTQGAKLLDWVGFDYYPYDNDEWKSAFASFKAAVPGKKYIILPGAQTGCKDVIRNDPTAFIDAMSNDPSVVWLAPFAWFSGSEASGSAPCLGVRDIPDLRAKYTVEGHKITDLQCSSSLADKWFCGKSTNVTAAINYLFDD